MMRKARQRPRHQCMRNRIHNPHRPRAALIARCVREGELAAPGCRSRGDGAGQRALHPQQPPVQDVSVDHRRPDVLVAEVVID